MNELETWCQISLDCLSQQVGKRIQFALYVGQLSKLKVQELCIDEFSLAFEKKEKLVKSKCFHEKPYFFSIPELGFEGPFYVITLVQIRATQKSSLDP